MGLCESAAALGCGLGTGWVQTSQTLGPGHFRSHPAPGVSPFTHTCAYAQSIGPHPLKIANPRRWEV